MKTSIQITLSVLFFICGPTSIARAMDVVKKVLSIAWQNVAYHQQPHTSFFIGQDIKDPPKPNIVLTKNIAPKIAAK